MSNVIRIKRRVSGAAGAPSGLKSAELAYNMVDNTIYAGFGDDGAGNATSIKPVGGEGSFVKGESPDLTGTPTAPTAAADTNTNQLATTAFVIAQAATTTPATNGTAAAGVSKKFAREDHVHAMPAIDQLGPPSADVSLNNRKITNLADPVSAQDAATKAYVDAIRQGLDIKGSVRVASTASLMLTAPGSTIDGITMAAGDRVLVKDQLAGSQNGIYVWNGPADEMTRSADADTSAKVTGGMFSFVEEGTVNADSGWVLATNATIILGTTTLAFAQFSGAGQIAAGAGLTKTGNTLDVVSASASRIIVNADSIDLATTGIAAGTYSGVTVDSYGRVTNGTTNGLNDSSLIDGGTF